ncbi:hypothetical protein ACHHYP_07859 [Achlya hypogyna]|uniref:Uncharacterized protein n=1 Tax=Achlya hypogyna TaxID=1202772 RepID=A0A1V9ZLD5_ACHHY|nr:hypothetical protein ACHHYP_07859 [Achlya hypogyna]
MAQQRKPPWRPTLNSQGPKARTTPRRDEADGKASNNPFGAITSILPTDFYEEKRAFASKTCRGQLPRKDDQGRQPYGVKYDQIDNNVPHSIYDTDRGKKQAQLLVATAPQGIAKTVEASQQNYTTAFKSQRGRFMSVPTYKMSTFAANAKEPYASPESMGPGTYRLRPTTLVIKHLHDPNYTFASQVSRFETPSLPYREPDADKALPSTLGKASVSLVAVSKTPRFTSDTVFPENYASSKQQRVFYPPDIVYDKPLKKDTIEQRVKTTHVKYTAMTSNAERLVSTASMVHNTIGVPILHASTGDALGPGAYVTRSQFQCKPKAIVPPPSEPCKDRFDMKPNKNAQCVETRFRRFCLS